MCAILPAAPTWAAPKTDPLAATRSKLDAIQGCLGGSSNMKWLTIGLLSGFEKPGSTPTLETREPSPPPDEYMESLDRDLKACEAASRLPDAQQQAVLDAVRNDIAVKTEDCRRFGMGRMVPVSIKTVRGNQVENGWQVFYRWVCPGPLQPEELSVPNLTSPANKELPPGVYTFRAAKRNAAGRVETTDPVTITVGNSETVPIELPIQ